MKEKILAEIERLKDKGKYSDTYDYAFRDGNNSALDAIARFVNSLPEEPVSEKLGEIVLEGTNFNKSWYAHPELAFKAGAERLKSNLWKDAQGTDLPEIDREVIVLIKYNTQRNIHNKEYSTYKVGFGHRPNPDGWDGKNIDTNEVTHYTPKLYDKGGWNAPDIVYWLDIELPKEIEL